MMNMCKCFKSLLTIINLNYSCNSLHINWNICAGFIIPKSDFISFKVLSNKFLYPYNKYGRMINNDFQIYLISQPDSECTRTNPVKNRIISSNKKLI